MLVCYTKHAVQLASLCMHKFMQDAEQHVPLMNSLAVQ